MWLMWNEHDDNKNENEDDWFDFSSGTQLPRKSYPARPPAGPFFFFFFNSLAPGKFELYFRYLIFQIISVIDGWGISCELALRWMSLDLTDDQSTLVQVMAWCRQANTHYLSQCWPRSLSAYSVIRPQWVIHDTDLSYRTIPESMSFPIFRLETTV